MDTQEASAETTGTNEELINPLTQVTTDNEEIKAAIKTALSGSEEKVVAQDPDDKFASKFAALSRKERQIQQKEAEFKSLQRQIDEERNTYKAFLDKKSKAKENPLAWLEEAGLSYDEITEHVLRDGKLPGDHKLTSIEQKLAELEKREADRIKESAEKRAAQQIDSYKSDIKKFVNEKADDFELINAFNQHEVVYSVIEQHFNDPTNSDKKLLSIQEASEIVEKYLETQVEQEAKKISGLKKLKSKLFQPELKTIDPSLAPKANTVKTLTNQMSQESPPQKPRFLSDEERKTEAAKLLRFVTD